MKIIHSLLLAMILVASNAFADEEDEAPTGPTLRAKSTYTSDNFNLSQDQHGLGFGLIVMGSSGLTGFYDYNLHSDNLQIHTQLDSTTEEKKNLLGDSGVKLEQHGLSVTGRYVFNNGWYVGGGVGYYNTTLEVTQGAVGTLAAHTLNFYRRGILGIAEGGWQGNDFYYFHIGIRPSVQLTKSEDYDLTKVYDVSNHRSSTEEEWANGQRYTALVIGFGWYIQP